MKLCVKIVAVLLLAALVMLLAPSSVPLVIAEESEALPVYAPVALEEDILDLPMDAEAPYEPHASGYSADNFDYDDGSIHVHTDTMRRYDTTILVTWVQIANPTQIRTIFAGGKIQGTMMMRVDGKNGLAANAKAVLAINGDNCKDVKYNGSGYIIRNGEVYRERTSQFDFMYIDEQGDMHIIPYVKKDMIEAELLPHIVHSFNFGPGLVIDGEIPSLEQLERNGHNAPKKRAQRICIAQMDKLSYVIVATEGPENKGSVGLTLMEFAELLRDLGAKQAYNLDGGSSASLVMNYKKINALSTGKKRSVSDAICFVTAVPED